jgi:hypothetical protein
VLSGHQFFAAINVIKSLKPTAYFIVNSHTYEIENISAEFISMFGLDVSILRKKHYKI